MTLKDGDVIARLREAVVALKDVRSQRDELLREKTESIAIIGMACRLPANSNTPEEYYDALLRGVDAITAVPAERWQIGAHIDSDPRLQGARWGGFIKNVESFDAAFFGISPREAERLDPQQRLLLEVTWEAFERSGIVPSSLGGTKTGVFLGIMNTDYYYMNMALPSGQHDAYSATGNGHCFPAGRIAYTFGLQGPAMTIDTACSSSLVSTHLACQSLRTRDSDLAIAGGVNLMLDPIMSELIGKTGAFAPDGRCKSFDARGNGYVRGEGCGVILLKRLSDAQREGDTILAVIRGSAVNQDGRSTGLTTPNVLAQQSMLEQALTNAQLTPADIGYIEAHGTGTPLGDPIEMEALRAIFSRVEADQSRCYVGSVKTNIGHLEAAAGVAGLMKIVLALENQRIPKNLHFRTLNPRVSLEGTPLAIASEMIPWPRSSRPRRAGVSSFGMSGTNAHVILEEAPIASTRADLPSGVYLIPLSGKTPDALVAVARSFQSWLKSTKASVADIAYTASLRRTHHEYRIGVVGSSADEIASTMDAYLQGQDPPGIIAGKAARNAASVVFVFPGQGAQTARLGYQLFQDDPVFRDEFTRCAELIQKESGFSIIEELRDSKGRRSGSIDIVQPLLFAIQAGLAALWRSWGVEPSGVVGHSMGEIAAAYVCGALSLEDAISVICRRSRLLLPLVGKGAMALVELTSSATEQALQKYAGSLSVAVSNSLHSTVVAGDPTSLDSLLCDLEANKIFCQRLKVDVASHSPQMTPLHPAVWAALAHIQPRKPLIPMRSTVTGDLIQDHQLSGAYWADNLRKPVLFGKVIQQIISDGSAIFLEISSHPTLIPFIDEAVREAKSEGTTISSLRFGRPERQCLLSSLASLYVHGYSIGWRVFFPRAGRIVDLPTYPWQKQRHWLEKPQPTVKKTSSRQVGSTHPLIGLSFTTSTSSSTIVRIWQSQWSLHDLPFLSDHRIGDQIIVPGATYIECALIAAKEHFGLGPIQIDELIFVAPLILTPDTSITIEVAFSFESPDLVDFRFSSQKSTEMASPVWTVHTRARISRGTATKPVVPTLAESQQLCRERVELEYTRAIERRYGIDIRPAFQGLQELWRSDECFVARVEMPGVANEKADDYLVHPILLDSALRALITLLPAAESQSTRLLLGIRSLRFWESAGSTIWNVGQLPPSGTLDDVNLMLFGTNQQMVLAVEGVELGQLGNIPEPPDFFDGIFFHQRWAPYTLPESHKERFHGRWLLLCDPGGVAEELARLLEEGGEEVVRVSALTSNSNPPGVRTVHPTDASEVAALIAETVSDDAKLSGIIDCFSLSLRIQETDPQILDAQLFGCTGTLHLVQALLGSGLPRVPPLWLVVRGTQTVESETESVGIAQAPLWGLGRAIAAESSDIRCIRVDLDARGDALEARVLHSLLHMTGLEEDEIAIRQGRTFAGRLESPPLKKRIVPAAEIRSDSSYLVTGGLGGLGLVAARWLAKSGAKHIALLSRRGATTKEQAQSITEIESLGAHVLVLEADVGVMDQLRNAFTKIDIQFPPLRGILHTAGVVDVGVLEKQSVEKFHTVFTPKIVGTWNLHILTRDRQLDFLILYSSMAGLFGSIGVSNYVAANNFLDTFASYRRARGLPATSIDWGWFAASASRQLSEQNAVFAVRGYNTFDIADSEIMLSRILHDGWPRMGLLSLDAPTFMKSNPHLATTPRFKSLFATIDERKRTKSTRNALKVHTQTNEVAKESPVGSDLLQTLKEYSSTELLQRVDEIVRQQLGQVLHLNAAQIETRDPLQQYGVDSLMTIELRNRLQSLFGVRLSIADIWSQSDILAIARLLVERIGGSATTQLPDKVEQETQETQPSPDRLPPTNTPTSADGWLVTHKARSNPKMRLICFPYAGGGAPIYSAWSDLLSADIEVIAVQPPGRYERIEEAPPESIQAIVRDLIPLLLPILNVPFAMFGHCLGAITMLEVARRLAQDHGLVPMHLFASGAPPPQLYLVPNVVARSGTEFNAILRAIGFANEMVLQDNEIVLRLLPIVRSDFNIAVRYEYVQAPKINAPITAFVGDQDIFAPAHIVGGWQAETSRDLTTHTYSGGHYFLVPERESICRIVGVDLEHDLAAIAQNDLTRTSPERWIVRLEARNKPRLRVFCCAGLGNDSSTFALLARIMPPDVELCAIEFPGHGQRNEELPLGRFENLVSFFMSQMTEWLECPFAFLGHDLGALVLFEVMRHIRRNGGPSPKALFVLGAMAPDVHYFAPMHHLPVNLFADALRLFGLPYHEDPAKQRLMRADCAAFSSYQYREDIFVTCRVVAFIAENDELIPPMGVQGWNRHTTGEFELHRVSCTHSGLTSNAAVLGACLLTILQT